MNKPPARPPTKQGPDRDARSPAAPGGPGNGPDWPAGSPSSDEVRPQLNRIYLLTTALFGSTLIYGALVYWLEIREAPPPLLPARPELWAGGVAGVGLAGVVGIIGRGQRQLARVKTAGEMQRTVVASLIGCELVALSGLLLYLGIRSLEWFTVLLGLSWVAFGWVSSQIPKIACLMGSGLIKDDTG